MAENGPEAEPDPIPLFIRRQLEKPPILPGESAREFKSLFYQIEFSAEDRKKDGRRLHDELPGDGADVESSAH